MQKIIVKKKKHKKNNQTAESLLVIASFIKLGSTNEAPLAQQSVKPSISKINNQVTTLLNFVRIALPKRRRRATPTTAPTWTAAITSTTTPTRGPAR